MRTGIFPHKKNNPQQVESDYIVQNSTLRSTRERNGWILLARKTKASTAERRWRNPVWLSSCVTPAGTSTNLTTRQNKWDDNTHTHWHRMTRMAGPDCAVIQINKYTHTHRHCKMVGNLLCLKSLRLLLLYSLMDPFFPPLIHTIYKCTV